MAERPIAAESIRLGPACVGSAELFNIQDASMPQVNQQCASVRDRSVAGGCMLARRSLRVANVGFSHAIHRVLEAVSDATRSVGTVRSHAATSLFAMALLAGHRDSGDAALCIQAPPLDPSGRARGAFWSVLFRHAHFYASPARQWITVGVLDFDAVDVKKGCPPGRARGDDGSGTACDGRMILLVQPDE